MSVFQVMQFTVFSWWIAVNPIVFNIGQINCPISGRLSERPTYGQKNGLISGRFIEKSVLARNTGFFMAVIGKGRLGRPYGLACAACFEELAGVFVVSGALHHTIIFMNCLHVVNRLAVSLTSSANSAANGSFPLTVVNEIQVLLTTHKSTSFSKLYLTCIHVDLPLERMTGRPVINIRRKELP